MFRRYVISIEVTDVAATSLHGLEKELGCSVSEPSNWLEYGSTKERGLTFLDKEGNELTSPIFLHQPIFPFSPNKGLSEPDEIKAFVYAVLAKRYAITPADVRIKIVEYYRL